MGSNPIRATMEIVKLKCRYVGCDNIVKSYHGNSKINPLQQCEEHAALLLQLMLYFSDSTKINSKAPTIPSPYPELVTQQYKEIV